MATFIQMPHVMAPISDTNTTAEQSLSIAAAAHLIGVTTHTLRKWESRHSIVVPGRTETGRRFYGAEQVRELQLVKRLLDLGHALPDLADLSEEELEVLLDKHDSARSKGLIRTVDLVGPSISRQVQDWGDVETRIAVEDERSWLKATPPPPFGDALIFETSTLPNHIIDALIDLRQNCYERMVVIARMTSRRTRRQLRQQGIIAIDKLIPVPALLALLDQPTKPVAVAEPSKQKFTAQQLAAVAAMTPSIDCECPNHIAQLLIDITAFEQYSKECTDTDPVEAKLHAMLGDVSAQARELFETALIAVAEADNLDLSTIAND